MQNFVEFQKFPNLEGASELIAILKDNDIPYEIDERGQRFTLVVNPLDNFTIVKINESDIEKVNQLLDESSEKDFENHEEDHYLYTFADKDIIDVIANQDEWSKFEIKIAQKIAKDRQIELTAEVLKEAKKEKIEHEIIEKQKEKSQVINSASWFIIIAGLSVINSILLTFEFNFHMLFGLGMTQFLDGLIYGITGQFNIYNIIMSVIVSSFFLIFWFHAKKGKKWAFIVGMIVYCLDMLLYLMVKDWLSIGLHVIVLIGLGVGLIKLIEIKKINESTIEF
jgi:hypothetical protein